MGTSRRQGARSITQIELLPKPPETRPAGNPWPTWPLVLRTNYSHEEGCTRLWSLNTREIVGKGGAVKALKLVGLDWKADAAGRMSFTEIPGSEQDMKAELVLLAMGFVHVEHGPLVTDLGLELDARGNIVTDENTMTSVPGVFAAGDAAMGASLIVRAIDFGRRAAAAIDAYLEKS